MTPVSRRHRLGVRLDGELVRRRQRREQPLEVRRRRERRRSAAEEDRLEPRRERTPLELQLGEQRVDVRSVLAAPADERDEVAVPAPVRTERQVDV